MKQTTLLFLLFTAIVPCFAQQTEPAPSLTKQDYLTKSKHQKTTALLLTGAGTVGLILTFGADASQSLNGGLTTLFSLGTVEPEYKSYTVPYLLSAAALGTGIAFFIASSKSKRKAKEMDISSTLKMERAPVVQTAGQKMQTFPALAIQFRLR